MTNESEYGMSSDSVEKATGKGWDEWLAVLDAADATRMTHKEIAEWLFQSGNIESGWWAQTVTVGYERARGMRKVNQRPDGFTFSVSKTMPFGISGLYEAWADPDKRAEWLPQNEKLNITTANTNKGLRGKWIDDDSSVIVALYSKAEDKTQVVVQIERLKRESDIEKGRKFWRDAMAALQESQRSA